MKYIKVVFLNNLNPGNKSHAEASMRSYLKGKGVEQPFDVEVTEGGNYELK